jgi:hypothetical protein
LFITKDNQHARDETARLSVLREQETATKLNTLDACRKYAKDVEMMKEKFQTIVRDLNIDNKKLALYGVAAKGLTVLTYTGLSKECFPYGVDDSPAKQGYFTPVSHIPIISRMEAKEKGLPDYFVVLAYNYIDVIKEKEWAFLNNGGHLINIMTLEII